MICFRDMTFCSAAERCDNRSECGRHYDSEARAQAAEWWEGFKSKDPAPIAFSDFSSICATYSPVKIKLVGSEGN